MILVSRLPCGCVAAALLSIEAPEDIPQFMRAEQGLDRIVKWEDRETISAERCELHEREYIEAHTPKQ